MTGKGIHWGKASNFVGILDVELGQTLIIPSVNTLLPYKRRIKITAVLKTVGSTISRGCLDIQQNEERFGNSCLLKLTKTARKGEIQGILSNKHKCFSSQSFASEHIFFPLRLSQEPLPIFCHDNSFHEDIYSDSGNPDLSLMLPFSANASSVWYCSLVFLSLHGLQMALVVSELIECPADVADGLNRLVSVKPNTALQ